MPLIQALSWSAFTLFLGAIFLGFRDINESLWDINAQYYTYAAFILTLRFKIALDDHFYFGVSKFDRWPSILGFVFGSISWILFIFSAYTIPKLPDSYLLLLIAIGFSLIWIVVVSLRGEGFYKEQVFWLITNGLYMMGLGILIWESKTEKFPNILFIDTIVKFSYTPIIITCILFLVLIIDFVYSDSFSNARH
jgi:hypothetical protein